MSIRRSLALAGAAALASSMVLAGAQGAMAVGATSSPSAAPAQAEQASARALALSLHGVPDTFVAGGDAREFTYRIDNPSKHDDVFFPLLKFKNKAGSLQAKNLKVEYQLPGEGWQTGAVAPGGGDGDDSAALMLLGQVDSDGNPADDAMLVVNRGKNLTIKVRVSFTGDAPLGRAGVVPVVFAAELDDNTHLPVDTGAFSCEGIRGAGFTIKKAGPSPTGKPSPTASTSPTATHTPTHTPSPSGSSTTSHSPSASPTATHTPTSTPTATDTPTTQPTTPAPTTGSPSAAPSASGSTAAPAPSGGSTEAQEPIDFPVSVPKVTPPKIVPAAVTKAKAAADNADKALATTGGGDDTTAIAAAGGAVLVAGVGTLVVLRRRKSAQQG
ncbi:LPXTG cell wall anchor domain-containing protein [Kitasatospora sp. NPDC001660]